MTKKKIIKRNYRRRKTFKRAKQKGGSASESKPLIIINKTLDQYKSELQLLIDNNAEDD
jgi:hypothetical protein